MTILRLISPAISIFLSFTILTPFTLRAMEETHPAHQNPVEDTPQPVVISPEINPATKHPQSDYANLDLSSILESAYQGDVGSRDYIFKRLISGSLYEGSPQIDMDKLFNFNNPDQLIENLTNEEAHVLFNANLNKKLSSHHLQKLFTTLHIQAEQGDAAAQNNLGWMYKNGLGVEKNAQQAFFWFQKSADQGYAAAQNNLAWEYEDGEGVEKNDHQALSWYHKAAERGSAAAQHNLGWKYRKGEGVEKNDQRAIFWFNIAADQGCAAAQHTLGMTYYNGVGVDKNSQKALLWFHKAAEQGYVDAQTQLGIMYDLGKDVEKNVSQALFWYLKAAEQGVAVVQSRLGVMYQKGEGCEPNCQEALLWSQKAAAQGYAVAQNNLGYMYRNGKGVEKNAHQAFFWHKKAAEQGHALAQSQLGLMYEKGEGVEKNDQQALFWLHKAAEKGILVAKDALKKILCLVPQNMNVPLEELKKENDLEIQNLKALSEEVLAILLQLQGRNSPPHYFVEFLTACPPLAEYFKVCSNYVETLNTILHHLTSENDLMQGFMISNITTKLEDASRSGAFSSDANYLHCVNLTPSTLYFSLGSPQNLELSKLIQTLSKNAEYIKSSTDLIRIFEEKIRDNFKQVLNLQDGIYTNQQLKKLYSPLYFESSLLSSSEEQSSEGQLSPEEREKIENEIKRLMLLLDGGIIQHEIKRLNLIIKKDEFILDCLGRMDTIKEKLFEIIQDGIPLRNKIFAENSSLYKLLS